MIQLIFNKTAIPRTTTRKEWREIYRWKRSIEREMDNYFEAAHEAISLYGKDHPTLMRNYLDRATNPPVIIYPPTAWKLHTYTDEETKGD